MTCKNTMTEREFQDAVVDIAHLYGWRVFHARAAGTNKGWRTPVAYDGKGYPDLTLVHPGGFIVFAEMKSATGKMSDDQETWADVLLDCSSEINTDLRDVAPVRVFYRLWKPRHGDEIAQLLSFGRVKEWTP